MPAFGVVPFKEPETRSIRWYNTLLPRTRRLLEQRLQLRTDALRLFARRYEADYLALNSEKPYKEALIKLFQKRRKRA